MTDHDHAAGVEDPLAGIDTRSASEVASLFDQGADANLNASCRDGSIDVIPDRGHLLATGDLHDNPLSFARVVSMAALDAHTEEDPRHITLHEVVHSDRLMNGMDFSHRALLRVAALKTQRPDQIHTLLANHELAQIAGAGITKDGMNVVKCFNEAVDFTFGDDAPRVHQAIGDFIRSMPLALRIRRPGAGDILCAHSLPGPDLIDRFDFQILDRPLDEEDYRPRRGAAHIMVWGRGHAPELLTDLGERFGVDLFILGHEKAEQGWLTLPPNAVILNTDHDRAAVLPIDLASPPTFDRIPDAIRRLDNPGEHPAA